VIDSDGLTTRFALIGTDVRRSHGWKPAGDYPHESISSYVLFAGLRSTGAATNNGALADSRRRSISGLSPRESIRHSSRICLNV
jgi:hypothetical protein